MITRILLFTSFLLVFGAATAHEGESHDTRAKAEKHKLQLEASAKMTRIWSRSWGRDYFPNIVLLSQDREELRFFDDVIEDRVVAINFIFTSCEDSCPLETAQLKRVYDILGERMGKDVFFYSISIDPEQDTPEVLKAYKQKFGIDGPGWTFLTGNEAEIILLRKKFGLYQPDLPTDDDHNINLVIGNQATARWMKRSPFENPYVMATQLGDWLHNWKPKQKVSSNSYTDAPVLRQLVTGESLFRTRCSSCHGFGKDGVGPDLMNVTQLRDRDWLTRWIKEPDKMLVEKDPLAIAMQSKYKISMPNLRLDDQDVEKLMVYMAAESERRNQRN